MKEQLGHASIQVTVDTYGHLIPGANRAAVERLDDAPAQLSATQAQPEPYDEQRTIDEMAAVAYVAAAYFRRTGRQPEPTGPVDE